MKRELVFIAGFQALDIGAVHPDYPRCHERSQSCIQPEIPHRQSVPLKILEQKGDHRTSCRRDNRTQ